MAATCARVAPCLSPCQVASKYLKDTTAVHGTVNIYVGIGKGPGNGVQGSGPAGPGQCVAPAQGHLVGLAAHGIPRHPPLTPYSRLCVGL